MDGREDEDSGERAGRVPNAELVKHVRIREGKVRDDEIRQQQPPEHRGMNDAAGSLPVTANRIEIRLYNGGFDGRFIDPIEIHFHAACQIRLLSKWHVNETYRAQTHFAILAGWHVGRAILRPRLAPYITHVPC